MDGEPTALFVAGDGVQLEALWWHPRPTRQPMPAIVLVHPCGDDAQSVSPASKALRDAGYHALAISMRGFGRSGGVDDCGLGQTNDLVAVLRWLAEQSEIDDDRIGVWGRSQGGMVALLAAAGRAPSSAPLSPGTR